MMTDAGLRRVMLPDAALEVDVRGCEPVVLIQTALLADEFEPIASSPALRDDYRLVPYHRRGYAGSSPVRGRGSIPRDAMDCRRLLAEPIRTAASALTRGSGQRLGLADVFQTCDHPARFDLGRVTGVRGGQGDLRHLALGARLSTAPLVRVDRRCQIHGTSHPRTNVMKTMFVSKGRAGVVHQHKRGPDGDCP